jgi:hypothetical protein
MRTGDAIASDTFRVQVAHSHREPTDDGRGHRSVRDPDTTEVVLVEVDLEAIALHYGPQACRTKRGVSRHMHGMVKIRHMTRGEEAGR